MPSEFFLSFQRFEIYTTLSSLSEKWTIYFKKSTNQELSQRWTYVSFVLLMPWPIKEVIAERFNADIYIYAAGLIAGYIILQSAIKLHSLLFSRLRLKMLSSLKLQKDNIYVTTNVNTFLGKGVHL